MRKVSLGGESELPVLDKTSEVVEAASALSMFSQICNKELISRGTTILWDDDEGFPCLPDLSNGMASDSQVSSMNPRVGSMREILNRPSDDTSVSSSSETDASTARSSGQSPCFSLDEPAWKRIRSVSMDGPVPETPKTTKSNVLSSLGSDFNIVSPMNSPVTQRLPMRKVRARKAQKAKRDRRQKHSSSKAHLRQETEASEDHRRSLNTVTVPRGKTVKKILRKKFSWKNYPEVSANSVPSW